MDRVEDLRRTKIDLFRRRYRFGDAMNLIMWNHILSPADAYLPHLTGKPSLFGCFPISHPEKTKKRKVSEYFCG